MPTPSILLGSYFLELIKKIEAQYEVDCQNAGRKPTLKPTEKRYGYGKDRSNDTNSIRSRMRTHQAVDNYLKEYYKEKSKSVENFNGKTLYTKRLEADEKPNSELNLSEPYRTAYALYAGYENLESFLTEKAGDTTTIYYKGYAYSHAQDTIKSFQFNLVQSGDGYNASLTGFEDGRTDSPFKGSCEVTNNSLFINLKNKQDAELKIIVPEYRQVMERHYLQGVLTTISDDFFPLSVRIFLVRMKEVDKEIIGINKEEEQKIKRYLMLHRQILRAPETRVENLDNLKVRGVLVEDIKHMIGNYWFWYFINDNKIAQIHMKIADDFTVRITNPVYRDSHRDQYGEIKITTSIKQNMCVLAYPNRNNKSQLISSYIIEMSHMEKSILKGVYCTIGTDEQARTGGTIPIFKPLTSQDIGLEAQLINSQTTEDIQNYFANYTEYPELLIIKNKLVAEKERRMRGEDR